MVADGREGRGPLKRVLTVFLLPVYRSDGQAASYRNDGVALGLYLLSLALLVAIPLVVWLYGAGNRFAWLLVLLMVIVQFLATVRLRRSIRVMEGLGNEGSLSFDARFLHRLSEFVARRSAISEEKLLARSTEATARGDQRSAARYRARATRARKSAGEMRDLVEKERERRAKPSSKTRGGSSGSKTAVTSAAYVMHDEVANESDDSGWLDWLDGLDGLDGGGWIVWMSEFQRA